ncbi:helix-turn-helix domain-containing protein [Maribacter polysiphoniae]|uniref:AraC family transcriptional regulator n=2 Tax=Maribacter polysiphoniae TaxID=429344 RepID=A0A316E409_9FLAO|nr:helix-turn-helix transcriptional regulator [Maribacter polysiphoniae]PWK24806.1 AraC family transcriptional regulator [Maribacter polysiphoniae]
MKNIGILITFLLFFIKLYPAHSKVYKENQNLHKGTIYCGVLSGFKNPIGFQNENLPIKPPMDLVHIRTFMGIPSLYAIGVYPIKSAFAQITSRETSVNSWSESHISFFDNGESEYETSPIFNIPEKYAPKLNFWIVIYLYVAMIGFYIAIIINFNRKIDFLARILISTFVFIHSFFIFHVCFSISNYEFVYPHAYRMSLPFSLLYGPLLYFYFKRITQQYRFKKRDLFHLVPTVLLIIYVIPIYLLPAEEKLNALLTRYNGGFEEAKLLHVPTLVALKLSSLIVYGYFIRKLYLKSKNQDKLSKGNKIWNGNLYRIHILYVVAYSLYGFMIVNNLGHNLIFHSQISAMALMVLYLGYSANIQPQVFSGLYSYENQFFLKYEKSGLTESLSTELKERLKFLFDEEKIYKENDINLETIADRLNTTRHNASQVINEHFNMNFHKLINKYRIQEAMSILDQDYQRNLNIIDIAYEVGYNNKVTFNKAFKEYTLVTPSEYQRISVKA